MKASQVLGSLVLATSVLLTSPVASATLPVQAAATASTSVARVQGPQPFLFILCKFAGEPAEPESPAFFENMLVGPAPSLADYWRQVSSPDHPGWQRGRRLVHAGGTRGELHDRSRRSGPRAAGSRLHEAGPG